MTELLDFIFESVENNSEIPRPFQEDLDKEKEAFLDLTEAFPKESDLLIRFQNYYSASHEIRMQERAIFFKHGFKAAMKLFMETGDFKWQQKIFRAEDPVFEEMPWELKDELKKKFEEFLKFSEKPIRKS